ncbi:AbrB/MazE/SpoVT family DNA-binding domain-containing protein [Delftia sp. PS-11]|uniref:AbrB/MazE/SpoVT family DNA-binding domain-containing protein n=1 Tax=Delftia sp. PS-11 TaxID=2767222 RepID=UPI0024552810|nr:AbrB/MazE/SpoVT family DNA-binding domain-containing protein [Delftia sp. PS-11]KAJ8745633.1 AbrB/MazE/SpoVT family DNA-binding domain-containing protein [Delftia sp. PS-11]
MQVSKWGNSLAVRIPAAVVQALALREGDQIEITVQGARSFSVNKAPDVQERLKNLRTFRDRLPDDFHFSRADANGRN